MGGPIAALVALPLLWMVAAFSAAADTAAQCHYTYSVWNTLARRTVARIPVSKARSELTQGEIGPLGCTPCIEDQISIQLPRGRELTVCRRVAKPIHRALTQAIEAGAAIETLVGYRPSMSRGPADAQGNRTQLSFHAYGVAVDINEQHNGLYDRCPQWGPACRLIKGGPWRQADPLSLSPAHPVVAAFKAAGFGWGGELDGQQKDFMHFSPSGG